MERTTSRFGTVDLMRIDKLPPLWPRAHPALYSNRACFGGWRRASDALDRQTIAGETMSSCESLQLEKSISLLKIVPRNSGDSEAVRSKRVVPFCFPYT